jgi:hypothetical protein
MHPNPSTAMREFTRLAAACALLAAASGCRTRTAAPADGGRAASAADFTRAVETYLAQRGDLCVGRPSWPIDVSEGARTGPDAVQLPVLERLGLVTSSLIAERRDGVATPFSVRRYRLTSAGRARYLDRQTRQPALPDGPQAPAHADFCVLELTLGKVTKWQVQPSATPTALVSYTYGVRAPAWARDPGFARVFPAVARLIAGAGSAELVEGFTLTPAGWTANELLPKEPAPSSAPSSARSSAPQAAAP